VARSCTVTFRPVVVLVVLRVVGFVLVVVRKRPIFSGYIGFWFWVISPGTICVPSGGDGVPIVELEPIAFPPIKGFDLDSYRGNWRVCEGFLGNGVPRPLGR